ncbi:MAG: fasciclin domain-containing protein [Sandaracinaceae bacterium]
MRTQRWIMIVATLVALPLALVGCDEDPDPADGGTDAGMADAGDTTDGGEMTNTLLDIAAGNPDFSMLAAAATRAGITGVLSAPGNTTVFAPNNDAFAATGITMEAIEAMEPTALQGILTYHAVSGQALMASDLTDGPITMAAPFTAFIGTGDPVTINGGNAVAGGANVIMADIVADNGVIHVIDRVLLPPTVADLARYGGLTDLVGALGDASLVETLGGAGPFTVFAPTNAAFGMLAAVPTGDALSEILLYHVVGADVGSDAIPGNSPTLATREYTMDATTREVGLSLLFDTTSGVAINGGTEGADAFGATVAIADLAATNGTVHVIDRVLVPMNIAQVAIAAGFTELVGAVSNSDDIPAALLPGDDDVAVIDALSGDALAPLTVFAPTNEAFTTAFTGGTPAAGDALLPVLASHVVAMALPVRAEDLPTDTTAEVPALTGPNLTFDASAPSVSLVGGNTANIAAADIGATNGIVHVIDAVLLESTGG